MLALGVILIYKIRDGVSEVGLTFWTNQGFTNVGGTLMSQVHCTFQNMVIHGFIFRSTD